MATSTPSKILKFYGGRSDEDKIHKWTTNGLIARKEYTWDRIDNMVLSYGSWWSQLVVDKGEEGALRYVFDRWNSKGEDGGEHPVVGKDRAHRALRRELLTEEVFLSLLREDGHLPPSEEGVQAGKVIFRSLLYLAAFPFPYFSDENDDLASSDQKRLSITMILRAITWLLPGQFSNVLEQGNFSRYRTTADHRRLIFQSLSSPIPGDANQRYFDRTEAMQRAARNQYEGVWRSAWDCCLPGHDEDGDEIYHDLLDVVYSTQDDQLVGWANVRRDGLREVGKEMVREHNIPSLYDLGIPMGRMLALTQLLLASRFDEEAGGLDLREYDACARAVCDALYDPTRGDGFITWPRFDDAVRNSLQDLFQPVFRLLLITPLGLKTRSQEYRFVQNPHPDDGVTGSEDGRILTKTRMSLLDVFLDGSVEFEALSCFHRYSASRTQARKAIHLPVAADAFVEAMETVPEEAIVVVSGKANGTRYVFGVFSPQPKKDGTAIQPKSVPDHENQERCAIFQLEPTYDVFRGVIGQPGWAAVGLRDVVFGQPATGNGVVLALRDGLCRLEMTHQGRNAKVDWHNRPRYSYRANGWRGNWELSIDVDAVEIWSEVAYSTR